MKAVTVRPTCIYVVMNNVSTQVILNYLIELVTYVLPNIGITVYVDQTYTNKKLPKEI